MSVNIKVSYTEDEELSRVKRLLSPMIKKCKVKPRKGRFKLAYIEMKDIAKRPRFRTKNS